MAKKKTKRKIKTQKILITVILLTLIGFIIFYITTFLIRNNKKTKKIAKEIEVVDSIDNFGYELNDNETKYYNELFNKLKDILKEENYDEQEYAEVIAKLFLADFYDLDNKVMKSDIGGTQYVYEGYREDFEKGAMNSIYKYVENNIYGDRKQTLPKVKEISQDNITTSTFKYDDTSDNNAYVISLTINYEKDLGYPTKAEVTLIHNNNRLELAKLETRS